MMEEEFNNAYKQLCRKCKYRGRVGATPDGTHAGVSLICNYMEITGRPRILECYDPKNCTVFKPGKRQRMNKPPARVKK